MSFNGKLIVKWDAKPGIQISVTARKLGQQQRDDAGAHLFMNNHCLKSARPQQALLCYFVLWRTEWFLSLDIWMTPVFSIPTLSILLNGNKWSEFFYLCTSRNSKKKDAQTLQRRSWFDCDVHRETFCFLVKTINICSGQKVQIY